MTDREVDALQRSINDGFRRIEERLATMDDSFHDVQQAVHGLMFKLLRAEEVNEIRSTMKNPPDVKNFPAWLIR